MSDRDVVDIFHPRCMQLWSLLLHGCPPRQPAGPLENCTPPPLAQSIAPAEPDPLKPNPTPRTYIPSKTIPPPPHTLTTVD